MFFLSILTTLVFYGFGLTTPLLCGLYLARPHWRTVLVRLMAVSAGLLLAAGSILLAQTLATGIQTSFGADELERYAWLNRLSGPYWLAYWAQLLGQGLLPQVLWRRSLRRRPWVLLLLVPGMLASLAESWFVRYYASNRDYLPSSWGMVSPNQLTLPAVVVTYLPLLFGAYWVVKRRQQ
ncbi:hypothetical protein GCM10022409_20290 [Hymenobacter glaciei]|uniref:Uncharacterized protein n=1 Tax=Hymenobacter glaciei TaxID=877209 RepID=A0ABP7U489_9BACT